MARCGCKTQKIELSIPGLENLFGDCGLGGVCGDCCPSVLDPAIADPNDDGTGEPLENNGPLYACDVDGNITGIWVYNEDTSMWELKPIAPDTDTVLNFVDNGDGTATFTNPNTNASITVSTLDTNTDTFVTFNDNGDGTYTFVSADGGTQITITDDTDTDTFVSFTDNGDGSYTFTSADGNTQITIPADTDTDTVLSFVDNGDGTVTFADPNTGNNITVSQDPDDDTFVTFVDNGDGTSTFTSADGNSSITVSNTDIDTVLSFVDNGDGTVTFTDPNTGNNVTVSQDPDDDTFMTAIDNGDGTTTFTSADGNNTYTVSNTDIDTDTVLTFVDNGDGTATFTDPNTGNNITVSTQDTDTVLGFVDNGDGTATFTDPNTGNQITVLISAAGGNTSSLTDNTNGTYTHDDGAGNTQDIDTRANSNPFDPAGSDLTGTNVQAAIDELANVNEGWRIQGAAGAGGAQAEPTRDDAISVGDDVQHIGHTFIGGAVGNVKDALHSGGGAVLETRGGITILGTDNSEGLRPLHIVHEGSRANDRRWEMVHRLTDNNVSGYLRLRPIDDAGAQKKNGFFWDNYGNSGHEAGFAPHTQKAGAEQVYVDVDNPAVAGGVAVTTAPATPWTVQNTHRWAKYNGTVADWFVMNGLGTVTQLSSHPEVGALLMAHPLNPTGRYLLDYNVFSGIGTIKDAGAPLRTLMFNIDTGEYTIYGVDGLAISFAQDDNLKFGDLHPIMSGFSGQRGRGYFDAWSNMLADLQQGGGQVIDPGQALLAQFAIDKATIGTDAPIELPIDGGGVDLP